MNSFTAPVLHIPDPFPASGTERVDALMILVSKLLPTDPAQALQLSLEALQLATDLSYAKGIAEAHWSRGKSIGVVKGSEYALEDYCRALALFEEMHNPFGIFKVVNSLANACGALGRYEESDAFYQRAIALCKEANDAKSLQTVLYNLGCSYDRRGRYGTALLYLREALAITREHNLELETARTLHNIGEITYSLGNYAVSLGALSEAASISSKFSSSHLYSMCLASMGSVYVKLGKLTTALDYTMQYLHKAERDNRPIRQAKAMFNIGYIYNQLGNTATAISYYLKCLRICEQANDRFGEAETLRDLAEIFLQLGNTAEALDYALKALDIAQAIQYQETVVASQHTIGRIHKELLSYPEALQYLQLALETAVQLELWEQELHLHNTLATVYKKLGDTNNSRHHARQYKQLAQQYFNEEEQKRALQMMQAFEEQKTRHDMERLQMTTSRHVLSNDVLITANKREFEAMAKLVAPSADKSAAADISVSTFGRFAVVVNGRELTADDWQRKKARDIFKILLINHRKAVAIDEIVEHLWPNAAGKNILPTIWNSISYIRKALEPGIKPQTASSYIAVVDKTYILNLGDEAHIDFLRFKHVVAEAQRTTSLTERLGYLEEAVQLYSGDFLHEDLYEEWSCFERESLKNMYVESLTELANAHTAHNKNDRALTFARKILEIDRTYEEAYEIILTILAANGQKVELQKTLQQCRDAFQKELACNPPAYLENMVEA